MRTQKEQNLEYLAKSLHREARGSCKFSKLRGYFGNFRSQGILAIAPCQPLFSSNMFKKLFSSAC